MNQVVIETLQSFPRMLHNPFVFYGSEGQPFHNGTKHSDWQKYLKQAGIKNFCWHDLRHTFTSRLVIAGINLHTVSNLMGHYSTEMPERHSHRAPDFVKNAVNVLVSGHTTGTRTGANQSVVLTSYGPVAQKDRAAVS